ncbi:MAG: ComEC/Rec2 family competence protein [Clostridia bacterium]|nr:ComEC/Rec2 family competence protein [Clostridia bacterium]
MRILWRRPLFCCCILSVLLVILAGQLSKGERIALLLIPLVAAFVLAVLLKKQFRKVFLPFLCCLLASLLLLSSSLYFDGVYPSYQKLVGEECKISGYVDGRRNRTDSFLITVTELNGETVNFRAALDCAFASGLQVGDHIETSVIGESFEEDGLLDGAQSLTSDGVKILFRCEDLDGLLSWREEGFHPLLLFRKWNHMLSIRLQNAIGGEEGSLATALLLGNKSGLSSDTTLAFRRAGVSHLLALSGLHISILIAALEFLLRRLMIGRKIRMIFLCGGLLFYLALTGFQISCIRASLMVFAVCLAKILWEDPDPLTSLGVALYLTLLFCPYLIGDIALWMSYLAAFGILVFSPAIRLLPEALAKRLPQKLAKLIGRILGAILVGFAANAALLLFLSLTFGEASITSILATAVLSLPMSLTLIASIFTLFFPALGFLPKFFASFMIGFSNRISDWPGVLPSLNEPLLIGLLIALTVLFLAFAILKIKNPLVFLTIPLAVILLFGIAVWIQSGKNALQITDQAEVKIEDGTVYVFCKEFENAQDVWELKENLRALGTSEIHHLTVKDHSSLQTYDLARLSASIRVFCLHLPQPKTKEELAFSKRLEQEASLHRIYVVYDN